MRVFEFESELKMMVDEVASGMEYFDRRASFLVIPSGPADANDGNDHSFPAYAGPVARASTCCRQRVFSTTREAAVPYEFNNFVNYVCYSHYFTVRFDDAKQILNDFRKWFALCYGINILRNIQRLKQQAMDPVMFQNHMLMQHRWCKNNAERISDRAGCDTESWGYRRKPRRSNKGTICHPQCSRSVICFNSLG